MHEVRETDDDDDDDGGDEDLRFTGHEAREGCAELNFPWAVSRGAS